MPAPTSKKPSSVSKPILTSQPFELRASAIQGKGAFATQPISKDTRIIEYLGERISQEEADARYDDSAMSRHHTFLFSVDDDIVIDAGREGNDARFINHSCNPNCQAFLEKKRIFIYALRDIAVGEELSYDYGYERVEGMDAEDERLYVCRCGAANCRGTILAPPAEPKKKEDKPRKKSSSKASSKKSASSRKSPAGTKRKAAGKSGRTSRSGTRAARS